MAKLLQILNGTQHSATPEQVAASVIEPGNKSKLKDLITFDDLPTTLQLQLQAESFALLCYNELLELIDESSLEGAYATVYELKSHSAFKAKVASVFGFKVMIGGAPFMMAFLEKALNDLGITPVYAFSTRESIEVYSEDGTVKKSSIFKHIGFIEV